LKRIGHCNPVVGYDDVIIPVLGKGHRIRQFHFCKPYSFSQKLLWYSSPDVNGSNGGEAE
jgi:hypothetical protein